MIFVKQNVLLSSSYFLLNNKGITVVKKTNPRGISFTGELLKELDGYISNEDPDFPKTPMMQLNVMEDRLLLVLEQTKEYIQPEDIILSGTLPSYIRFQSDTQGEIHYLIFSIPLMHVKVVRVESGKEAYAEYNVPGQYKCVIDLDSGEQLTIVGGFREEWGDSGMPEIWYYEHQIKVETNNP